VWPVPVEGQQELQAAHEMRRHYAHQQATLVVRLADEANIAQPEIAESTVNQLRGRGRGAPAKVATFDECDGEAVARGLGRDPCSDDPSADHEQIEVALRQLLDRPPARVQGHSGFVQAFRP
jgi:hypothetical protein